MKRGLKLTGSDDLVRFERGRREHPDEEGTETVNVPRLPWSL